MLTTTSRDYNTRSNRKTTKKNSHALVHFASSFRVQEKEKEN